MKCDNCRHHLTKFGRFLCCMDMKLRRWRDRHKYMVILSNIDELTKFLSMNDLTCHIDNHTVFMHHEYEFVIIDTKKPKEFEYYWGFEPKTKFAHLKLVTFDEYKLVEAVK